MQVSSDDADDTMWSTWTGAAAALGAVQAICGFDCYVCRRPKAGHVDKQPYVPVYVNQCLVSGILQEPLLFESRLMGDALIDTRGSCSVTGFLLIVDMMSSQAAGDQWHKLVSCGTIVHISMCYAHDALQTRVQNHRRDSTTSQTSQANSAY